jgi:putative peptidoglycan lipid II flippase
LLSFLENRKHFIFTSLGTVLSSLGILTCVSIVSNINSIAVGMLVSAFVFLLIEIFVISKKDNIKLKLSFDLKNVEPKFKKQYYWLFFASLTMGSTFVVDQYMANYFGESSVSGLNFGYRLSAIISGLGALSLGAVALPVFSKFIADNQSSKIPKLLQSLFLVLFLVSLPVVGLIYYYSDLIISLLFERGAFGTLNVSLVSSFLKLYIFQFPFYVAGVVLSRLMSSLGKNKIVFAISFIALFLNITFNILFTNWIGISGIALSTSVVYLFTFIALLFSSKVALKKIES